MNTSSLCFQMSLGAELLDKTTWARQLLPHEIHFLCNHEGQGLKPASGLHAGVGLSKSKQHKKSMWTIKETSQRKDHTICSIAVCLLLEYDTTI